MNGAVLSYALVFLGAGIGGVLRHAVNRTVPLLAGVGFPFATLFVNVLGSFAIGALTGWFAARDGGSGQGLRLFLTTGLLGGFTTFSAFSLDAALLWQAGRMLEAGLYAGGSVLLSLAGVAAGLALVRAVLA